MDNSGNYINGTLASVGGIVGNVHLPTVEQERVRITQEDNIRITDNGDIRLIKISVELDHIHASLAEDIELEATLTEISTLHAALGNASEMSAALTIPPVRGGTSYSGRYEITPSTEEQVLPTSGKILSQDITVNPIPNNYGLVTWNGSHLMVS